MSNIPNDPIMLYSWLNTMLRDKYNSLAELCAAEGLEIKDITTKLQGVGFEYDPLLNQFR